MALDKKSSQNKEFLSYYLTININTICRICLEKSAKLAPIFDPIKPPHFSLLIMACAQVEVQEADGLPPFICQKCISKLNVAFQFKMLCESSDAKLRQCFQTYNLQQPPDYSEYTSKEEISFLEPKQNAIIDTVFQQPESHQEAMVAVVDNSTVKVKPEDQEKTDECIERINHKTTVDSEAEKPKRSTRLHECNTCSKVFRTKPSLVHHIRIHTGERPYVCHLCQKRFINGGHLHTHMRTHTGEKNHVCAACSKGFATAQQLTKHTIAIHTSERPYGCTYCPKRFASSSNLNTHIKIHTGEKNFHCEFCGKTFSTKGQLQSHLLVHTGEKAFLCEYCNKRFSQKAHLTRHLKIHNRTE